MKFPTIILVLLISFLLSFSIHSISHLSSSFVSADDRYILINKIAPILKGVEDGSDDECFSTWNLSTSICNFKHVGVCSESTQQVKFLDLSSCKLRGTLPNELNQLHALETFFASDNSISGTLPDAWKNMTNLTKITLDNNRIYGSLPDSYGWGTLFSQMLSLSLNRNRISGEIPTTFQHPKKLRYLRLRENQLTGNIPYDWCKIRYTLDISYNKFTSLPTNPSSWQRDCYLSSVDCSANLLSVLPRLDNFSSLKNFVCARNLFTGNLPDSSFSYLNRLSILDLSLNMFTGPIPASWAKWSLTIVRLRQNRLSGEIPSEWWKLSKLFEIDLSHNRITGNIPTSWSRLHYLEKFSVKGNLMKGEITSDLINYKSLTQLEVFDVSQNCLTTSNEVFTSLVNRTNGNIAFVDFTPGSCLVNDEQNTNSHFYFSSPQAPFLVPESTAALTSAYKFQQSNPIPSRCYFEGRRFRCMPGPGQSSVPFPQVHLFQQQQQQQNYESYVVSSENTDFMFSISCVRGINLQFLSSCATARYVPLLQCFLDKNASVPCTQQQQQDETYSYFPSWHNKSISLDFDLSGVYFFSAASSLYRHGLYYRVLLVFSFSTAYLIPRYSSQFIYFNATTHIFQRKRCEEMSAVAIWNSSSCVPCPQNGVCDGTTKIQVGENPSWRIQSDLLPFYECDESTSEGCWSASDFSTSQEQQQEQQQEDNNNNNSMTTSSNNKKNLRDGTHCKSNYKGFFCSSCSRGYGMKSTSKICKKCAPTSSQVVFLVIGIILLLIVVTIVIQVSLQPDKDNDDMMMADEDNKNVPVSTDYNNNSIDVDALNNDSINNNSIAEGKSCCTETTTTIMKIFKNFSTKFWIKFEEHRGILEKVVLSLRQLVNHLSLIGILSEASATKSMSPAVQWLLAAEEQGNTLLFGSYAASLRCLFPDVSSDATLKFNFIWTVFALVFLFEAVVFFAVSRRITVVFTAALFLTFLAYDPIAESTAKLLALCHTFVFYKQDDYLQQKTSSENIVNSATIHLLSSDLAQVCDDVFIRRYRVPASLSLIFFLIGIPLIVFFVYRSMNVRTVLRDEIFGFLTADYKISTYWWELIMMGRKLLGSLAIQVFTDSPSLQLQLYTVIAALNLCASFAYSPLLSRTSNYVDQICISSSLLCSTVITFAVTFPRDETIQVFSTILIFVSQIISLVAIFVFFHRVDDEGEDDDDDSSNSNSSNGTITTKTKTTKVRSFSFRATTSKKENKTDEGDISFLLDNNDREEELQDKKTCEKELLQKVAELERKLIAKNEELRKTKTELISERQKKKQQQEQQSKTTAAAPPPSDSDDDNLFDDLLGNPNNNNNNNDNSASSASSNNAVQRMRGESIL